MCSCDKYTKKTITVVNNADKLINEPTVFIYSSRINKSVSDVEIENLYPSARAKDILDCEAQKVKVEKYAVWKLFEFAVKDLFGIGFEKINFSKTENGKWVCDDFEFSLSHSGKVVAVALSKKPVGVDVQEIRPIKHEALEKYLTDLEADKLKMLPELEAEEFLLKTFSAKESLFKLVGEKSFSPSKRNTLDNRVKVQIVKLFGIEYVLSVASEIAPFYFVVKEFDF